jgi:putative membrane protein
MTNFYLWLKALHIVSVIAWMAGMLYLPRLFVYHVGAAPGSELSETLKVMERRLLRAIINPAMIATWGSGLAVATAGDLWSAHWLHVKLLLVLLLSGMHGLLARWCREFARDANRRSARFYRFMNEVPTLLMIGIVIVAVLKPF